MPITNANDSQTAWGAAVDKLKDKLKTAAPTDKGAAAFLHILERTPINDPVGQEIIDNFKNEIAPAIVAANEVRELSPIIKEVLKRPEYNGQTIEDIFKGISILDLARLPEDSLPYKVIADAREEAKTTAKATIKRAEIKRAEIVEYPLDKKNSTIWNLLKEDTSKQVNNQLQMVFDMLPKKSKLKATSTFSIDFAALDDVTITKQLEPFDKRVYIAVSALFNAGDTIITATQIHYAMGCSGTPSNNQLTKIGKSLSKMTSAIIQIDNLGEATALKDKYPHFKYEGSLLPIEKLSAVMNGKITESAIHIFREPPLMAFAKGRKQITTIDVALLQSPINKTNANLRIDDYLIERISRAKHESKKFCRILFRTLYERAAVMSKKQRQRAPEKIYKYLDYYQQEGFIVRYTKQPDGVTIYY